MSWPRRGVAFDAPIVPIKPKWPDTAFDFAAVGDSDDHVISHKTPLSKGHSNARPK